MRHHIGDNVIEKNSRQHGKVVNIGKIAWKYKDDLSYAIEDEMYIVVLDDNRMVVGPARYFIPEPIDVYSTEHTGVSRQSSLLTGS